MGPDLGQNRLPKETQRSPDELNPCAQTPQSAPLNGQATLNWPRIAVDLIPCVTQVLNGALAETVRTGARTAERIRQIVVGHGLSWALPPELIPEIQIFVLKYLDLVAQQKNRIEEFLKRFSPIVRPIICYQVYHHGRTDYYYNDLPKVLLNLKKNALFWIDSSANEQLSRGRSRIRSEWLPPKAEEMLRFLCRAENAGETILFSELFLEAWKRNTPASEYQMCNSINGMITAINTFADERFIRTVSDKSEQNDKRVLRIRGANKFIVGKEVSVELVIIKRIAP